MVTLEWLLASLNAKHPANETDFQFCVENKNAPIEPPSPASKKSIQSLNSTFKKPQIPKLNFEARKPSMEPSKKKQQEEEENIVVQQYLKNTSIDLAPPIASSTPMLINPPQQPHQSVMGTSTLTHDFLEGKVIFIDGFTTDEDNDTLIKDCLEFGANIVEKDYTKIVDYVIVSAEGILYEDIPVKYKNLVTDIWLEDCYGANKCFDVLYYHKPFLKFNPEGHILTGEEFVITNYQSAERNYLKNLIKNLGAEFNDVLKKVNNPILISPNETGKKFKAAIDWGMTLKFRMNFN